MGSHWLAVWWSSTYRPVSFPTRNELVLNQRAVRAHSSGSWRCSHSSLGPTACDDSAEPERSRMRSAPSCAVRTSISAVARVSIPYRMAGRSGAPDPSTGSRHGPIPLMAVAVTVDSATGRRVMSSGSSEHDCSHHTACASCSNQPGRGRVTVCSPLTAATTVPFRSTATALVLEVPMSSPIETSVTPVRRTHRSPRRVADTGRAIRPRGLRVRRGCGSHRSVPGPRPVTRRTARKRGATHSNVEALHRRSVVAASNSRKLPDRTCMR